MTIESEKACCSFYHSGGAAVGAGCTKEYLDSVGGDLTHVMNNGAPIFNGTANLQPMLVNGQFQVRCSDGGPLSLGRKGVCVAYNGNYRSEILADDSEDSFLMLSVSVQDWPALPGYQSYTTGETRNGNSILDISNVTSFNEGDICVLFEDGYMEWKSYEILEVDEVGYIVVNDGGYLNSISSFGYAYPNTISLTLTIGGAYNDFQTMLDDQNAYYHNQWVFFNEEIAPSVPINGAAYYIYSSHDGEAANNTKLYIVGYNTHAYDCLPAGHGYFPEGTQNAGTHYKTPLERAKDLSDASIKADLPVASSKNLPGDWDRIFRVYTSAENIQFMGIYFEVAVAHWPIIADNSSTGSLLSNIAGGHVSYDAAPEFYGGQIVRVNDAATGGGIVDCFFKGVEMFNGTTPSADNSGDWEFAYNVCIYTGNVNPEYSGPVVHHNIFVKSQWGVSAVARSFQNVYNNIFYLCRRAGFNLNGTEGRTRAWNNIIVMDESDELFWALFNVSAGGTVDYFDYNCYCNQNGQPVSVFAHDNGINSTFNFDNLKKGEHDIEKAPQFIDPDNWDFRLRASSPCLNSGRPDIQNNPTNIGPYSEQKQHNLYGQPVTLYGI